MPAMARWTHEQIPDQTGATVVITGANSGLGLRSAEALAAKGARVLMACRNPAKAAAALEEVQAVATGPAPEVVPLDLADLDDVAACAERLAGSLDHIDVLMDNAGVMALPRREETQQGFEMQWGTNHLGHFALTGRLLPLLRQADAPRVVTVSSMGHRPGRIRWDDTSWTQRYSAWPAYFQTKLANLLFTAELSRQAAEHGSNLLAVAAHPGTAHTSLAANGPARGSAVMRVGSSLSDRFFSQSDAMGALPQLYAATMPDVAPNSYYGPDGFLEQRGYPKPVGRTRRASSAEDAKRLWALSEELTGVTYDWG
jgi:NAD(P)-dependent dehydrogenase (short-subunit alcohol dehydrogenase family)